MPTQDARNLLYGLTGIQYPTADPAAMRALGEHYADMARRLDELGPMIAASRRRVQDTFDGRTSEYYAQALDQFTTGRNDYVGQSSDLASTLSRSMREGAATAEYTVMMIWGQLVALLAEIAFAIAMAKWTFGASLNWIPMFQRLRSLMIGRILLWAVSTAVPHQIIAQLFASLDSIIQRIQIGSGTRDHHDGDLTSGAHVGAAISGIVSAFLSTGLSALLSRQFRTFLTTALRNLRDLPPPPRTAAPAPAPVRDTPVPPPARSTPDPDAPPGTTPPPGRDAAPPPAREAWDAVNRDLAEVLTRNGDSLAVPFDPDRGLGQLPWQAAGSAAAFRDDLAGVFQRSFGSEVGEQAARDLGRGYADAFMRHWGTPDLVPALHRALADSGLPPTVNRHLAETVPGTLTSGVARFGEHWTTRLNTVGGDAAVNGALAGYTGDLLANGITTGEWKADPSSAFTGAVESVLSNTVTSAMISGIDRLDRPDLADELDGVRDRLDSAPVPAHPGDGPPPASGEDVPVADPGLDGGTGGGSPRPGDGIAPPATESDGGGRPADRDGEGPAPENAPAPPPVAATGAGTGTAPAGQGTAPGTERGGGPRPASPDAGRDTATRDGTARDGTARERGDDRPRTEARRRADGDTAPPPAAHDDGGGDAGRPAGGGRTAFDEAFFSLLADNGTAPRPFGDGPPPPAADGGGTAADGGGTAADGGGTVRTESSPGTGDTAPAASGRAAPPLGDASGRDTPAPVAAEAPETVAGGPGREGPTPAADGPRTGSEAAGGASEGRAEPSVPPPAPVAGDGGRTAPPDASRPLPARMRLDAAQRLQRGIFAALQDSLAHLREAQRLDADVRRLPPDHPDAARLHEEATGHHRLRERADRNFATLKAMQARLLDPAEPVPTMTATDASPGTDAPRDRPAASAEAPGELPRGPERRSSPAPEDTGPPPAGGPGGDRDGTDGDPDGDRGESAPVPVYRAVSGSAFRPDTDAARTLLAEVREARARAGLHFARALDLRHEAGRQGADTPWMATLYTAMAENARERGLAAERHADDLHDRLRAVLDDGTPLQVAMMRFQGVDAPALPAERPQEPSTPTRERRPLPAGTEDSDDDAPGPSVRGRGGGDSGGAAGRAAGEGGPPPPGDGAGTPRSETFYELDYLLDAPRLVGPRLMFADHLSTAIGTGRSTGGTAMTDAEDTAFLQALDAEIARVGVPPFLREPGHRVTFTVGGLEWTADVRLGSERNAYRLLPADTDGESPQYLLSRGHERGHTTGASTANSTGSGRTVNLKFSANPVFLGVDALTGASIGPQFSLGGKFSQGARSTATSASVKTTAATAIENASPVFLYTTDLRLAATVTPPSGHPAPTVPFERVAVVHDGMALALQGEVSDSSSRAPQRIVFPAEGALRTEHGGLPLTLGEVVHETVQNGTVTRTPLGDWVAERLVPRGNDGGDAQKAREREALRASIREALSRERLQDLLPGMSAGSVTLTLSGPDGGDRMVRLSSRPLEATVRGHAPKVSEFSRFDTVDRSSGHSGTRSRSRGFSIGAGFGAAFELPSGHTLRMDTPTLEYSYNRSRSKTHDQKQSGSRRTMTRAVAEGEDVVPYRVRREFSVRVEGDAAPTLFRGEGTELVPVSDALQWRRAAAGTDEAVPAPDPQAPLPPFLNLRRDRVTDFTGATVTGYTRTGAADPDGFTVYERLAYNVLQEVAAVHPGMVIPDLARTGADYARRRADGTFLQRTLRERWGFRRNRDIARDNTMRVLEALSEASLRSRPGELASPRGLAIHLTEDATLDPKLMVGRGELLRPDTVTVRVHADFGALRHRREVRTQTGTRSGGSAGASSSRGKGSTHSLSLGAGFGQLRPPTEDARGLPSRFGSVSASLTGTLGRSVSRSLGLSHTSDEYLFFPGGSDRWEGDVAFSARLHEYDADDLTRGGGGVPLPGAALNARVSLSTTRARTAPVEPRPPGAAGRPALPTIAEESGAEAAGDGTAATDGGTAPDTGPAPGVEPLDTDRARRMIGGHLFREAEPAEPDPTPERERARRLLGAGGTPTRVATGLPGRDGGDVLRNTYRTIIGPRRGPFAVFDGFGRKLRRFLETGSSGRSSLENLLSSDTLSSGPGLTSRTGVRSREEMSGGLFSPHDVRFTTATRVEPEAVEDLQQVRAQMIMSGETTLNMSSAATRSRSVDARVGGGAAGTTNRYVDREVQENDPVNRLTPGAAVGPIPLGAPGYTWNLFSSRLTDTVTASFSSTVILVPKHMTAYAYRVSGRITQAAELMKNWGILAPGTWYTKFRGWTAQVSDLLSGYVSARDAQEAGVVLDRVTEREDGGLELTGQPNPDKPAHARVRPGFESSGRRAQPADPTAALRDLATRLAAQGLELTAQSRERLLQALTTQLGNAADDTTPVPVRVRALGPDPVEDAAFPRPMRRARDARVHLSTLVDAGSTTVDHMASSDAMIESHTWKTGGSHTDTRATGGSFSAEAVLLQPTPFTGDESGPDDQPGQRPLFVTPAAGRSAGHTDSRTQSRTAGEEHRVRLDVFGPYVKLEQDTTVSLRLVDGAGLDVTGTGGGGKVRTTYPYPYIDFSDPATAVAAGGTAAAAGGAAPGRPEQPDPGRHVAEQGPPAEVLAEWTRRTTAARALPEVPADLLLLPTAVGGGTDTLRDTAVVVVARSLNWNPGPDDVRDGAYTPGAVARARAFLADRLLLDPLYTPVDQSTASLSLKALFHQAMHRPQGTPILTVGDTEWRLKALPDFRGARILDTVPGSRLSREAVTEEASGTSTGYTATTGQEGSVRPAMVNTESTVYEDHAAVMGLTPGPATARGASSSAEGEAAKGSRLPESEDDRSGPAYLIEFDVTWAVAAQSKVGTPFWKRGGGTLRASGETAGTVSGWVTQNDAIRLGILPRTPDPELRALNDGVHAARAALAEAEGEYMRDRTDLEGPVRDLVRAHRDHRRALAARAADTDGAAPPPTPSPPPRSVPRTQKALERTRQAYREQVERYERSLTGYNKSAGEWIATLNRTRSALASYGTATPATGPAPAAPAAPDHGPAVSDHLRERFAAELHLVPTGPDPAGPAAATAALGAAAEVTERVREFTAAVRGTRDAVERSRGAVAGERERTEGLTSAVAGETGRTAGDTASLRERLGPLDDEARRLGEDADRALADTTDRREAGIAAVLERADTLATRADALRRDAGEHLARAERRAARAHDRADASRNLVESTRTAVADARDGVTRRRGLEPLLRSEVTGAERTLRLAGIDPHAPANPLAEARTRLEEGEQGMRDTLRSARDAATAADGAEQALTALTAAAGEAGTARREAGELLRAAEETAAAAARLRTRLDPDGTVRDVLPRRGDGGEGGRSGAPAERRAGEQPPLTVLTALTDTPDLSSRLEEARVIVREAGALHRAAAGHFTAARDLRESAERYRASSPGLADVIALLAGAEAARGWAAHRRAAELDGPLEALLHPERTVRAFPVLGGDGDPPRRSLPVPPGSGGPPAPGRPAGPRRPAQRLPVPPGGPVPGTSSLPPQPAPAAPGPGANDPALAGYRVLDTEEAIGAYAGGLLDDPARNPHAYAALPPEQRRAVYTYTRTPWIFNDVLRSPGGPAGVQDILDGWLAGGGAATELLRLNGMRWPTVDELRGHAAAGSGRADLIRPILEADSPERRLDMVRMSGGRTGQVVQAFDGVYPTAAEYTAELARLDAATRRPLPERLVVTRGVSGLGFLAGFDPARPQALEGTSHTEPGLMSTSLGTLTAPGPRFPVIMRIRLGDGARGLWVGPHAAIPVQRELLLPPGVVYRITGVRVESGVLRLEVLVEQPPPAPASGPQPKPPRPPGPRPPGPRPPRGRPSEPPGSG
ncbi:WXG100-like domain-containing protein [Nocardiopsis flavescens]